MCVVTNRPFTNLPLEGWTRMLSGILSIVPASASGAMIEELGNQLREKKAVIPAQICYIVSL